MNYKSILLGSLKLLFYSTILKPLYDFPSNIFAIQVGFIEKIINFYFLLTVILFIYIKKKIIFNSFSISLILLIIFSSLMGILNGTFFSLITLSQLYYFLMPLICFSSGGIIFKYCGDEFNRFILNVSGNLYWILIILTLTYIFLHNYTSYWPYFGYSSGLVFSYITINKKSNLKLFFGTFIDLFTGKRSTIAMWGFLLSLKKPILFSILLIIILIFFVSFLSFLPQRYLDVFYFSLTDERSMFLASGGRSVEWFGIISKIKQNDFSLFTGFGFGSSYDMYDMFQNIWETRHYSHLTPFTYLLIGGIFAPLVIYSYLIYYAFTLKNHIYLHFYYYYIVMLFLSISGGGLLAMPLPWIFLGFLMHLKNKIL